NCIGLSKNKRLIEGAVGQNPEEQIFIERRTACLEGTSSTRQNGACLVDGQRTNAPCDARFFKSIQGGSEACVCAAVPFEAHQKIGGLPSASLDVPCHDKLSVRLLNQSICALIPVSVVR